MEKRFPVIDSPSPLSARNPRDFTRFPEGNPGWRFYVPGMDHLQVTTMLTSHRLLQQYWHDDRYDIRQVRIWYTDRGAPDDRSMASGTDISLEPYYLNVRTPLGKKPVPYHRILLITYNGVVGFSNQKIQGLEEIIADGARDKDGPGP